MTRKARKTVSEVLARPLRTAPQGGGAWAVTEFIDAFIHNMDDRQYGILVVLLTIFFSYAQTAIENYKGKAFLRQVPPLKVPVVDKTSAPPA